MKVAAVILAAGASTRLGTPKQLLLLNGETLLDRAVRIADEAGCRPVIVVLGAVAEAIVAGCTLHDAAIVVNGLWREGMASSIRAGIAALPEVDGTVLMTCDMPAVTSLHLRALMARGTMMASHYANRTGVPAFFPALNFPELLTLTGNAGARRLLQSAHFIQLTQGELDIDTAEDVAEMNRRASTERPGGSAVAAAGRSQTETECG